MLHSLGRFGATTSQVDSLPVTDNGLDAVRATLKKMGAIIRKYSADATTVNFARNVCVSSGVRDQRQARRQCICALQNWVRDHIAYFYDPRNTELLQTPPQTLNIGTGDCDDKTILLLAALESIGYETELLAVGGVGRGWDPNPGNPVDPLQPPPFSHVLGAVRFGPVTGRLPPFLDGWLTLETIVTGAQPGYKPPGVRVIMPLNI